MDAIETISAIWDYLYGHYSECPLYLPGRRLTEDDDCDCVFEWSSDTIEVVADMVVQAIPEDYLRHRAMVRQSQYGVHTGRWIPGCMCGWADQRDSSFLHHGEALARTMSAHLDEIPIRLHVLY